MSFPVHFISGYLGCGKTTMVNCLLPQLKGRKVALILNDFGDICVDSSFIEEESGLYKQEVSGGQIFCPCTSGSFLRDIASACAWKPDLLIVEPSGLAKPSSLLSLLERMREEGKGPVFGSYTCVVDPLSFPLLSKTLNAVSEQARVANRFVINKIDLASREQRRQLRELLRSFNRNAEIVETTNSRVLLSWFERTYEPVDLGSGEKEAYATWGPRGRPRPFTLHPGAMEAGELKAFLEEIAPDCLRAKGFVETSDSGLVLAQIAAGICSVEPWTSPHGKEGLTIIQRESHQAEYEKRLSGR